MGFFVLLGVLVAVAVGTLLVGADSRPRADEPPQRWLAHPCRGCAAGR